MPDSKKGLEFLPDQHWKETNAKLESENATSSISNAVSDDGESDADAPTASDLEVDGAIIVKSISAQVPCTQKSENLRKYESIVKDTENSIYGEEILRKYNFKRRRDLESFLHSASFILSKPPIEIKFETNFEKNEKPLHPLKIAKDGSLRISAKQIKRRAKIDAPEGTEFIIKPLDAGDGEEGFKLIVIKK